MPNYRYHTPEPGRRNYCGYSSNMSQRQRQPENRIQNASSCQGACAGQTAASETSCAVNYNPDALSDLSIAMAYVPWQQWRNVYDAEKGLCQGTIFGDLDKPFCGAGGVRK